MHIKRYTHPLFSDIVEELLWLVEKNYENGALAGVDFDSRTNSEMRDTRDAIELIAMIGGNGAKAVPILTKLLEKGTHPCLPDIAAKALGSMGASAEPAIPLLVKIMLNHPGCPKSNYGHYPATVALGQIGSAKAVPYLIEAAKDSDPQGPGWRAIRALGKLGNKATDALPTLKELRQKKEHSDYYGDLDRAITRIETEDCK
jgi:hypothetical protein